MKSVSLDHEAVLANLLSVWQCRRAEGETATPTELCRDRPELLPELERRVAVLERMGELAGALHHTSTLDTTGSPPIPAPLSSSYPDLPGYEIVAELGRGGMGIVYKARQKGLDRFVALKMLLHANYSGPEERRRFHGEAEAVARLRHPNVVQVHEVGEHNGLPYFSLEFCAGGSLANRLDGTPWQAKEAAQLVETLARAMQAAHQAQVIHRDLKPANVLLTEDGTPKITDFGLARRVEVGSSLTATGAVLGTPSYMAPEQARGETKHAGAAADVYAMGAILYECLTGRPPFKAATPVETILQVLDQEAVSVRQLQPQTDTDLATICHKCLQKESHKRYASALELAEDCAAFLDGQPIRARPASRIEKTWRWCRRNPAVAGLFGLVALTFITGVIAVTGFALRAEAARQDEKRHAESEAQAKRAALRQLVEVSGTSGMTAASNEDHSLALLWCARAVQLASNEPDLEELNRIRVANWLRQVWHPQARFAISGFRRNQDRFRTFELSPDGNYLLAAIGMDTCRVWDCQRGNPVSLPASAARSVASAWEPKTGLLAVATRDGRIQLLCPPAFQPVEELLASGDVSVLAFSRDGQSLAWGGTAGARVWDRQKKDYIGPVLRHPSPVVSLWFSASGQLLATSALDNKARVFQLGRGEGEPLFPAVPHRRPEHGLAHGGPDRVAPRFTANEQLLVTVETAGKGRHCLVWREARSGKLLRSCEPPPDQSFLTAFVVSPTGDRVAVLWEDIGQLWNTREGHLLGTVSLGKQYNWCEDVTFSGDGQTLISGSHNMHAQFWSVEQSPNGLLAVASPSILQPNKIVRVAPSSDGRLAIALWDGTISLWKQPRGLAPAYSLPAGGTTMPLLSPDRHFVLPAGTTYRDGNQRSTRVYRTETAEAAGPVLDIQGILLNAAFSPDGASVATASSTRQTSQERRDHLFEDNGKGGTIRIWDWKSGKQLTEPIATPNEPRSLAFAPDGKTLAAVCGDYRIILIDPLTGTITRELDHPGRSGPLGANLWCSNGECRFSPDGRFLVTWALTGTVHVWDANTGRLLHTLEHNGRVEWIAFDAMNPALCATSGRDSVVYVWDLSLGQPQAQLPHPSHTRRARFSPDGRELITACADGMLRIWDWRAGKLKEGLAFHPNGGMEDFAFTADRHWLITIGLRDLQLTDWRSKTSASPLWLLGKNTQLGLSVPAEEQQVLVGGFSGSLDAYDLKSLTTPVSGTSEHLLRLAELIAGRRILETGQVVPLNSSEWAECWANLRQENNPE
ncbi:MAG TPA: protein kinase [Gemmataceae bacterium]|jgi:WD40 repeat protein/predicted Ser/Thr protein kinase